MGNTKAPRPLNKHEQIYKLNEEVAFGVGNIIDEIMLQRVSVQIDVQIEWLQGQSPLHQLVIF